jgi:uncharacterized protein (DUF1800 family)
LKWNPVDHLLSRFAFGPTDTDRAYLHKHGADAWIRLQVNRGKRAPGYAANRHVAAQGPLLRKSPYDVRQWLKHNGNEYGWEAMDQLARVTLGLQVWSPAQLYETLVDFFSNHLNVANHNGDVWNTRHTFDRDVIRKHALGSFSDMLLASAKNPAMLLYLNIAESTKEHVNENYGRELLELHTVGLHYKESDVVGAAKLLTGRTVDDHSHYVFDDYIHPTGKVKVLGFTAGNRSAASGEAAGDALLRYLARHPQTARHLAQKLCVRYVSDNPSASLVKAVARAYLANDTRILPMISTILHSAEFWTSRGKKVRRPTENLVASMRVLGVKVSNWDHIGNTLMWTTDSIGHRPLDWPAPNGYPDVATAWRSAGALMLQWNYHLALAGGWFDGVHPIKPSSYYAHPPKTSGDAIAQLTSHLTGTTWSAAHRHALQKFVAEPASTPMAQSRLRWLMGPLIALILDSPHHALR